MNYDRDCGTGQSPEIQRSEMDQARQTLQWQSERLVKQEGALRHAGGSLPKKQLDVQRFSEQLDEKAQFLTQQAHDMEQMTQILEDSQKLGF